MTLSLTTTEDAFQASLRIAGRAHDLYEQHACKRPVLNIQMDLIATHENGCRLDFARMETADDFNLMHDVAGIYRHLDRTTGKLGGCFLPRFAAKVAS